jgi:TP901 family phage tail tape measure protein
MPATIKIPAQFTAIDKFSHVVRAMARNIQKMSAQSVAAIKRIDHRLTNTFNKMGRLAQIGLGVGIGALFLNGVEDIKAYETNLVGVGKTTGMASAELKKLGRDTIALSNSLRGLETNKLLEFQVVAGQLGITGSKNILIFSETMAKLEKSTDIIGEQGAQDIARLLNITGEGIGVIDRFGAVLVALGNTTEATESQIMGIANEVGRSVSAYKLNSKEILALSAAMASMGVAPEAAGSAIGQTFRGIEMATISGGKSLADYAKVMGMTANETKELFSKDKQGAFNKLLSGLQKIDKEGGSVTATMNELGISDIRVLKGIIPLVRNYDALEGKLKLANDEFEKNAALNEEYAAATKTVATALTDIKKRFTNLLLESSATGTRLEKVQNILFYVADNMDKVVMVGGLLLASFVALKVAVGIVQAIEVATKLWTAAQWLLNIAMDANPIGLVIVAIAGLIALIGGAIEKYDEWGAALLLFLGPLGFVVNLFMTFRKHWDSIVEAFQTDGILAGLKRIGQVFMDALLYPMQQFLSLISKIPGVGKFAETQLNFISRLRENNNLNTEEVDSAQVATAKAAQEPAKRNILDVNINDPGGKVESTSSKGPMTIPVKLNRTQGAF